MGLSGRKTKQRIGADPRNLTWADNAARFGQSYLAKLGWDPSKGLGADGSGRTTHITVAQKLNLLGIGANAKQGADDIAWKQSKDYEMLLKRLNEDNQEKGEVETAEVKSSEDKKLKKRKREDDGNSSDELKKKRKKEKERKDKGDKEKKGKKSKKEQKDKRKERSKKECSDSSASGSDEEAAEGDKAEDVPVATIDESHSIVHVPRPIAHRARFLRSKKLASQSSTAVAEILGIAPSSAAVTLLSSSSATPNLVSTSDSTLDNVKPTDSTQPLKMEQLTTSAKSVTDYFKEKLAARSKSASGSSTPISTRDNLPVDADGTQRRGIGSKSAVTGEDSSLPIIRPGLGSKSGDQTNEFVSSSIPLIANKHEDNTKETSKDVSVKDSKSSDPSKEKRKKKKEKKEGTSDVLSVVDTSTEPDRSKKLEKKKKRKDIG